MVRIRLSVAQAKIAHAVVLGTFIAFLEYLGNALQHMALGGPRVVFSSLVVGALVASFSRAVGMLVRYLAAQQPPVP